MAGCSFVVAALVCEGLVDGALAISAAEILRRRMRGSVVALGSRQRGR